MNINTLILKALENGSLYGLEIIDYITQQTNGKLKIKQPSLYSALRRFENRGFVTSYWQDSEIGGRRHYYTITDDGKEYLQSVMQDKDIADSFNEDEDDDATPKNEENHNFSYKNQKNTENFDKIFADDENEEAIKPVNTTRDTSSFDAIFSDFESESVDSHKNSSDDLVDKNIKKDDIDYKDILGDLYVDDKNSEKTDLNSQETKPINFKPAKNIFSSKDEPSPSLQNSYYEEIKSIITGKKGLEKNKTASLEDTTIRLASLPKTSCKVVEELEKHYKQKKQNEQVFSTTEHYGKIDKKSLKRNSYKSSAINKTEPRIYLNINRLRFTRAVIMTLLMLFEISIGFALLYFKMPEKIDIIHYIIIAGCGAVVLIYFLTYLIKFKNFPDKKLKKSPALLFLNFLKRFMLIILLLAVLLSAFLMCGISFENLITVKYISYWMLPVAFICDILIGFFINLILFNVSKYYR